MKKIGNEIWTWLNGPDDSNSTQLSYFQRSAIENNQNRQKNASQQYIAENEQMNIDPNRVSVVVEKRNSLKGSNEIDDYDFYSDDHLEKIFDVVIEIQQEYDKKKQLNEMRKNELKLKDEKLPKALLNPEVQRQIKKQKTYKPYFLYGITIIQIIFMIIEVIYNWASIGSPFDLSSGSYNIMIGPSTSTLIYLGARWVPCMRTGFENENISCISGVEPFKTVEVNKTKIDVCRLYDMCGMGLKENEVPNQWWRFILPIFLHAGFLHIIANLLFQVKVGFQMEKDFGSLRIFIIYMLSGIGGFMFGADYSIQTPSVGCSGSLYGLMACLLLDLILNWKLLIKPIRELFKMLSIIILSLGVGLVPFIDNFSHVGGFITGILSGLILLPSIKFNLKDRIIKRTVTVIAIPALLGYMIYLIVAFYNSDKNNCKWCKYVNCLPINGWCDEMVN